MLIENILNNSINSPSTSIFPTHFNTWLLIGILILILIGTGAALMWTRWSTSPWFSNRIAATSNMWNWLSNNSAINLKHTIQEPSKPSKPSKPLTPSKPSDIPTHSRRTRENWCFVGEDFTGRWCVKVPSPESCTAERSFASQSDCLLVEASNMPAGILQLGGADMKPLRNLTIL